MLRLHPVFTAALFSIAKTWKQPKYPLTEEWVKETPCMFTVEYYSDIRNEVMPFAATGMDLEIPYKRSKSDRETNIIWYHLYVESKKKIIPMNLFRKQRQTHRF